MPNSAFSSTEESMPSRERKNRGRFLAKNELMTLIGTSGPASLPPIMIVAPGLTFSDEPEAAIDPVATVIKIELVGPLDLFTGKAHV
jgi:hypothetical protein